jgi:LysM domain
MRILQVLILFFTFFLAPLNAQELTPEPGKHIIVHTVKRGEELHLLAAYYLLNARDWDKIYSWNADIIKHHSTIHPGQELLIYVDDNWIPPYDLDEYVKKIGRR